MNGTLRYVRNKEGSPPERMERIALSISSRRDSGKNDGSIRSSKMQKIFGPLYTHRCDGSHASSIKLTIEKNIFELEDDDQCNQLKRSLRILISVRNDTNWQRLLNKSGNLFTINGDEILIV